jgi:murein endopeptidase
MARRLLALSALLATTLALVAIVRAEPASRPAEPVARADVVVPTPTAKPARKRRPPRVVWRHSQALGTPTAGRLRNAVRLPARGAHFRTWDPVHKRSPNRWTRRNGTDELVRMLLRVARDFGDPLLIGDLSRPHGGDFGKRFGPIGHASHQNGLDADVYFPRKDGKPRAPRSIAQVDRKRAQELVDRFVRAGAKTIFVGAGLRLRGPAGVVQPWPNHDDHLHLRLG